MPEGVRRAVSVVHQPRMGETWEARVRQVVSMVEDHMGMPCPNPQDYHVNLWCNGCGHVAPGTMHHPPEGWLLGAFGEDDFCPACRA